LRHLGAEVGFEKGVLTINVDGDNLVGEASHELVREMRASIQVMGPLLARLGRVRVSHPGGCAIGERPIDFHLRGLRLMGAEVWEEHGYIYAQADRLQGVDIQLDFPSVGATENLMMAAALARGRTRIRGAAKEPEIIESQNLLNKMGAKITGAGTDQIVIDGVEQLGAAEHEVMPDRIEAGTFIIAGAITGGDIWVGPVIPEHLGALIAKLKEAGVHFEIYDQQMRVVGPSVLRAVSARTLPYPGFPTDLQPQLMALMALANGTSLITENIYPNRFRHVDELRRMGARISVNGDTAVVRGIPRLTGTTVEATDLRAGAALILAGMAAEGETTVTNIHHVYRGYEQLTEKLTGMGANVTQQ
ncbi:MAG: UDP-N-acetylglucosamine 1-carboxyvinyltransferase, partial [Firmicutes bacterium]|nr:UDP-N-acetylglucosamine 1-carboxyvinyltransferase [Bacillota bacterium]